MCFNWYLLLRAPAQALHLQMPVPTCANDVRGAKDIRKDLTDAQLSLGYSSTHATTTRYIYKQYSRPVGAVSSPYLDRTADFSLSISSCRHMLSTRRLELPITLVTHAIHEHACQREGAPNDV